MVRFGVLISGSGTNLQAVIVFDGNHEPPGDTGEKVAGVRIVFSTAGSSADRVIEKLSRDARASA